MEWKRNVLDRSWGGKDLHEIIYDAFDKYSSEVYCITGEYTDYSDFDYITVYNTAMWNDGYAYDGYDEDHDYHVYFFA